jgi:hypothetical protein
MEVSSSRILSSVMDIKNVSKIINKANIKWITSEQLLPKPPYRKVKNVGSINIIK